MDIALLKERTLYLYLKETKRKLTRSTDKYVVLCTHLFLTHWLQMLSWKC